MTDFKVTLSPLICLSADLDEHVAPGSRVGHGRQHPWAPKRYPLSEGRPPYTNQSTQHTESFCPNSLEEGRLTPYTSRCWVNIHSLAGSYIQSLGLR